jgi:hypothetical protein
MIGDVHYATLCAVIHCNDHYHQNVALLHESEHEKVSEFSMVQVYS